MVFKRTASVVCCSIASLLILASPAGAFEFEIEGFPDDPTEPWREFIDGWEAFANWHFMAQELASLLVAGFLAALLAYHPGSREAMAWRRSSSRRRS